jgi:DNA-binding PadR family transcriptional regulator
MRDAGIAEQMHGGHRPRYHHEPGGRGPGFGPGFGPGPLRHGGPGPDGEGRGRRRGMRAPRGDVRAAVLQLLAEEPMHGYQLMQRIAERSEGAWRPSPGTIYPVLAQLEDEGLVEVARDQGRKLATLTDDGRVVGHVGAAELGDPFAALRENLGPQIDLRGTFDDLASAARQVVRSGTAAQQEAARTVLREARRSLYLILAEGEDARGDGPAVAEPTAP